MALLGERPRGTAARGAGVGTGVEGSVGAPGGGSEGAGRRERRTPGPLPGLALACCGTAVAWAVHRLLPGVPMLTAAVVLGIVAAHLPGPGRLVSGPGRPGLSWAGKRMMRIGVVLLGLELSLGDVLGLGWTTFVMVPAVVAATFFGTLWLGRGLGLPGDQPLLVATGYSICGASAIGAVGEARGSDERDAAASVALVTLCGTLAVVVLPLLHHPLGLDATGFGRWVGAGVHDVGQVVAAARTAGPEALGEAVLVKLVRVLLLAPLVAAVAVAAARRGRPGPRGGRGEHDTATGARPRRPPLVPLFVAGFLAAVAVRTAGLLPAGALAATATTREFVLAAALFGLGSAVHLPSLARTGRRLVLLGALSWAVVAGVSYVGVLLTV
ncbi:putative sulfate exporter family transporter [Streptomyces sp. TRM43335]|uniref:Putative sulfate exporter family transporter n=1 Tax=Streptomyces taklimakanensis TaxID=2569853 RepID=A0A6G2BJ43_9ACTN|nr:putative sulfate exporter family transporter [Streptomyces taklimakanensis]MTE22234.1 putative sulfate exporter family transporter [Streptomyces taklimakanensis]